MRHEIILSAMEEEGPARNTPLALVFFPRKTVHSDVPAFQTDCIDTLNTWQ